MKKWKDVKIGDTVISSDINGLSTIVWKVSKIEEDSENNDLTIQMNHHDVTNKLYVANPDSDTEITSPEEEPWYYHCNSNTFKCALNQTKRMVKHLETYYDRLDK